MPSQVQRVLKITSTRTFKINHPDEIKGKDGSRIEENRRVLEKMIPQFDGAQLSQWICP